MFVRSDKAVHVKELQLKRHPFRDRLFATEFLLVNKIPVDPQIKRTDFFILRQRSCGTDSEIESDPFISPEEFAGCSAERETRMRIAAFCCVCELIETPQSPGDDRHAVVARPKGARARTTH